MSDMLPKLFFKHFTNTSFIIEKENEIVGFIIGFCSQSIQNEAYIHFVGVHPGFRKDGIARKLYEAFFEVVKGMGVNKVSCVTSPINKTSIAYHTKMGFICQRGDIEVDGIPVHVDYDGQGGDRVVFMKEI
ncbi:GNAT family N-acetyltransferase [Bacillus sp. 31A1R]|uniref:GNAT family N-acetyltransferase n=1 Tax=Robertmurraya mangrovi TaxID=3098077 RepID=A0ABU5IYG0_9BACI|nr:GNAT family N-acetyltransferase [Bacillus sp. 31A1R]MDZ5472203.1 GNAT family N-acetyltransferase [Bacillus sp. 31A1R]